jgi:hypothetical protein
MRRLAAKAIQQLGDIIPHQARPFRSCLDTVAEASGTRYCSIHPIPLHHGRNTTLGIIILDLRVDATDLVCRDRSSADIS